MDQIEPFIASIIIKTLHKSVPGLTADDDLKITKAVTDFVASAMDVVAIYFVLRNARK